MSYWETGPWTHRKYTILRKYLEACEKFAGKYRNFAYSETHGGSGRIRLTSNGLEEDGSPLIAGRITPSFPCHIVEIDPGRFATLQTSINGLSHVKAINGDCNVHIDLVLSQLYSWVFSFFFIDPNGLVYRSSAGEKHDQLTWQTMDKIARHDKTEILLNFPLEALQRCGGYALNNPDTPTTNAYEEDISHFFGDSSWKQVGVDKRKLLDHYVKTRLRNHYKYIGAILIRSTNNNIPQYYLVYGSKNEIGGTIMRNIMKVEWVDMNGGAYPLTRPNFDTERKWLDAEFPLDYFVFEN
ncbi:MAG: three-Cys-motif partner protein TcmP [Nitrososphaerales archaeon]